MSLVGTRPILPDELEQYELHHRARIAIKPGITGMWQVSGRSDITDFEEIVRLDTEYISEWNIGLDIKILFKRCLWDSQKLYIHIRIAVLFMLIGFANNIRIPCLTMINAAGHFKETQEADAQDNVRVHSRTPSASFVCPAGD